MRQELNTDDEPIGKNYFLNILLLLLLNSQTETYSCGLFLGEMEVTVQDEEERPPPPPPTEEAPSTVGRESQAAALSAATEIAEHLVDSVLGASASEASRLQRKYYYY